MLLLIPIIKLRFNNIQIQQELKQALDTETKKVHFTYGGSFTNFAKAHNAGHFLLRQDCIAWVKNNICSEDIDRFLDDKSQMDILFPFAKDPHVFFL